MTFEALEREVETVAADPALAVSARGQAAGRAVMEALDQGKLRVATPLPAPADPLAPSVWRVHAWVKRGILLYFQNEAIVDRSSSPARSSCPAT